MNRSSIVISLILPLSCISAQARDNERPNFVWLMTEDVSKHYLAMFDSDGAGARTPTLEAMAKDGVVFTNAYSNAAVSSAARSTLITSCYAPRLAVSYHRRIESVALPEGLKMFPTYLRESGYHTSNAAKTDYNCLLDDGAWDIVSGKIGDWRKRDDKSRSFFHVYTFGNTHESNLQFDEVKMSEVVTKHQQNSVKLAPEHQDTPLMRYTYATFYDRITDSDAALNKILKMLREDSLLDNTFVFYFGDNGGALPGTKGYTTERGLGVPLVVYIPEKWRGKVNFETGTTTDKIVSFMDFGPSLLNLAGIELPSQIDGKPFLSSTISPSKVADSGVAYGYGDRYDELYTFNRTLRKGEFKYSRNYFPYQPKSLYALYRYKQMAFREWGDYYKAGKLSDGQSKFFLPQGTEELYDVVNDPNETINLANSPKYRDTLESMRTELNNYMLRKRDIAFIPEHIWLAEGKQNPTQYTKQKESDIKRYSSILDLQLRDYDKSTERELINFMRSADEIDRLWAVNVAIGFGDKESLKKEIRNLLADKSASVRSKAITYMTIFGGISPQKPMLDALLVVRNGAETLYVLNDIAYIKSMGSSFNITQSDIKIKENAYEWRLKYIN